MKEGIALLGGGLLLDELRTPDVKRDRICCRKDPEVGSGQAVAR